LEEHNFPICTLGICGVLESIEYLLERHNFLGLSIDSLPNMAIRSRPYFPYQLESLQDMRLYLFCHN
jgi:hypothetical protein